MQERLPGTHYERTEEVRRRDSVGDPAAPSRHVGGGGEKAERPDGAYSAARGRSDRIRRGRHRRRRRRARLLIEPDRPVRDCDGDIDLDAGERDRAGFGAKGQGREARQQDCLVIGLSVNYR